MCIRHHPETLVHLQVGAPALSKVVTGELGCVTPYIVTPGEWSRADLEYHAGAVATGKSHNAGHNCLAAEILITAADWPQRQEFLDILRCVRCLEFWSQQHKSGSQQPSRQVAESKARNHESPQDLV